MNVEMDIKNNLKRMGWTISAVADKLGVCQPAVTRIVSGNPTLANLKKIADVVGCSVAELISEDNETSHTCSASCPHCGKPIHISVKITD